MLPTAPVPTWLIGSQNRSMLPRVNNLLPSSIQTRPTPDPQYGMTSYYFFALHSPKVPMTNFISPSATGTMAAYIKAGTRSSVHPTCASTPLKLLLTWQSASMNGLVALDDTDTSDLHLHSHSQAMPSLCLVSYRTDTSFPTILNILLISSNPHMMMNYHGSDEC